MKFSETDYSQNYLEGIQRNTFETDDVERKSIEEHLWEVKDFLENVFDTSVDGIMVVDAYGCIISNYKPR